jgi:hypothetical protein
MPVENDPTLAQEVISILKDYSGRKSIELDQMIVRDVGINGSDGVLILYDLEERFGVDLNPLVEAHTTFLPPNWFDRLRGREHGPRRADLTVRQLIEFIEAGTAEETA